MKLFLLGLSLLVSAATAQGAYTCVSRQNAPAYYGTGQWTLTFDLVDLELDDLKDLRLRNASLPNLGVWHADQVNTDPNFVATNPDFRDYNRYKVEDAWCNYSLLLPKGLSQIENNFDGLISFRCEGNSQGSFKIFCRY